MSHASEEAEKMVMGHKINQRENINEKNETLHLTTYNYGHLLKGYEIDNNKNKHTVMFRFVLSNTCFKIYIVYTRM